MLKFNEFRKNNLTLYEKLDMMLDGVPLTEAYENEQIVYQTPPNPKQYNTIQTVGLTKHFLYDREHRYWWDSFLDPNFINFADQSCRALNGLFNTWIKDSFGKKPDSRAFGLEFTLVRDEYAFFNKDETLAWVVSTRPTEGLSGFYREHGRDYCTSFSIISAFNAAATDAKFDGVVKVKVAPKHKITLLNYELITPVVEDVQINGRLIHVVHI